jgi:hypothetical protein
LELRSCHHGREPTQSGHSTDGFELVAEKSRRSKARGFARGCV